MNYYLTKDRITLEDFSSSVVTGKYNQGYVFTRLGKGVMDKTRSLRINLDKFSESSENRRVLKKIKGLHQDYDELPLQNYTWKIHKLGKDFYTKKFGDNTMSASKIKEMFQETAKTNMNCVFSFDYDANSTYLDTNTDERIAKFFDHKIGFCLCYKNEEILHYAYPFYNLEAGIPNLGMGMMLLCLLWAKASGLKYAYLGSVVEPSSLYKLQFKGVEWFDLDQEIWSEDLIKLKQIVES